MSSNEEPYMTIILTNEHTGEPIDKDDPIHLSKKDYDFIAAQAEQNGLTFEEEFIREVRIGIQSLIERYSDGTRITISETEGSRRSYSYVVDYPLPFGVFPANDLPDELVGEIESIAQGDSAPPFLWAPDGDLQLIVQRAKS